MTAGRVKIHERGSVSFAEGVSRTSSKTQWIRITTSIMLRRVGESMTDVTKAAKVVVICT